MYLTLWMILLIAFASQCLFLIAIFMLRGAENRKARIILISLLAIILCILITNIWSATYLYRQVPQLAEAGRGMVLLLGPALYLYTLSILNPHFTFKWVYLLHLAPYAIAFTIIRQQNSGVSTQTVIAAIDQLMEGKVIMNWIATLWFVSYFIHLLAYAGLAHKAMVTSLKDKNSNYLMPFKERVAWLKLFTWAIAFIAFVFIGITLFVIFTGRYTIYGNFVYTVVLASLVYLIAFQAVVDKNILLPGFAKKYRSGNLREDIKGEILSKLLHLFDNEKVFVDANLKLSVVAKKVETHPNILSQVINDKLNKTFTELLNQYRVKEFKERILQPGYLNYSIMGVAAEVGYNSKSSFNVAFKKQTGITPSEYVKSVS